MFFNLTVWNAYYNIVILNLECAIYSVKWRKAIRKIWKIANISQCRLLPYINDCNYIDFILERRSIRFLYNIFNSENQLYISMIKYSLTNCDSTMGEGIRYLMHTYKFDMYQWYGSITPLFSKIDLYITSHTVTEDRCTGIELLGNYAILEIVLTICPLPQITKL